MSSESTSATPAGTLQLCAFWLAGRLFGVDIHDVKEVVADAPITPVFHAPPAVRGYVNIRGQIYLVVDPRVVFGFPATEPGAEARIVLFRPSVDEPFGILADGVDDVVVVASSDIVDRRRRADRPPSGGEDRRKTAPDIGVGVCSVEKGLLVVLNARGILGALTRKPANQSTAPGSQPDAINERSDHA